MHRIRGKLTYSNVIASYCSWAVAPPVRPRSWKAKASRPKGDRGEKGEPATVLWATISSNGSLVKGSGVTGSHEILTGSYEVDFSRDVSECSYQVTSYFSGYTTVAEPRSGNADGVYVRTEFSVAGTADQFYLDVFC